MLRHFLAILLISLVTFGLMVQNADAKRFGGGRSFGYARSVGSSFSRPSAGVGQSYNNTRTMNRWLGPLAGLAAGGLLASLFMGHGLGGSLVSLLVVGGVILWVLSFLRKKIQPAAQYGHYQNSSSFTQDAAAQFMRNSQHAHAASSYQPVGFDEQAFLRDAKVHFIRLQAAYDQKNFNDIREFTTPEVLAEIQLQCQERGQAENKTNVISIEAELLQVDQNTQPVSGSDMQTMMASVRFTGMIQENPHEPAASFNEIWHFKKEIGNLRWLVAGVQQA